MIIFPPILRTRELVRAAVSGLFAVLMLFLSPEAQAELILGVEVRVTVEDNIVGLLPGGGASSTAAGSAMASSIVAAAGKGFGGSAGSGTAVYTGGGSQSPGDLSVTTAAELGGMVERGSSLSFFASGFAERTDYQKYSEFDSNSAGVVAGMTARTGDVLSMRIAGFSKVRRYDNDPDRDGTGHGGTAGLKQLVTDDLWLRETVEYETYRASYQDFNFRGTTCRFGMGYDLTDDLLATAGYGFQARHYQDSAATALRTGTASLGMDYDLTDRWSAGLLYERQTTGAGTSDFITRNNIFSLAVRWDY